jgi:hypothetical protein
MSIFKYNDDDCISDMSASESDSNESRQSDCESDDDSNESQNDGTKHDCFLCIVASLGTFRM